MFSVFAGVLFAQDDTVKIITKWELYGETAPEWFTDGSEVEDGSPAYAAVERGIVYSDYSGHVYVSSRHAEDTDEDGKLDTSEPHVFVLDPETGKAPLIGADRLLTLDITSKNQSQYGGGYSLNNVTVTEDGSIFACNMTLASGPDVPSGNTMLVKAFRVYRWSFEMAAPTMIIDYQKGGYRLGDKFTVLGDWFGTAYVYAIPGENNVVLKWTFQSGVIVSEDPEIITLENCSNAGTSATVAAVPGKDNWMYVSGKGFLPALYTKAGKTLASNPDSLSQIKVTKATTNGNSFLAGRTIKFNNKIYMVMFSGDQSAFIIDMSKHGENVTDADVVGFTPAFGKKFDNAYGEGAVEFGIIDNKLNVFVCAPSNGIARYEIQFPVSVSEKTIADFGAKVYPNPANDVAKVEFTLPEGASGAVAVKVYDVTGKLVDLIPAKAKSGVQTLEVNTSNLSAGTYMYKVAYKNQFQQGILIIN